MTYVDGFVIPIHSDKLAQYQRMARGAGKIWREHGALSYFECAGDDLETPHGLPFGKRCKLKPGETVIFAWIVYRSRAHRDKVNAKVMQDPRIAKLAPSPMPFDMKRMSFGGFRVLVQA